MPTLSKMLRMSTCRGSFFFVPNKRPYHHGNLKAELLKAALSLFRETGAQGFTLREVARRAGVSHNAPYRHFQDKDDLLAAVAAEGFARLTSAMKRSAARGKTPLEQFRLCGRAYIEFALHWPQHFLIMFDLPAALDTNTDYPRAGEEAFATLLSCIVECQNAGSLAQGDPKRLALMAWCMNHGIAKLASSSHLPFPSNAAILEFADTARQVLATGMKLALADAKIQ
jgi:AcrR family transcriptional regulator